ncbi:MAG: sugar phosphate nucleotidyltransferase, partial [Cyanobacteria bacterium J06638_38]
MSNQKVLKAVIPAAGFGTRMYPATKALKKELFPIIGQDGRAKPIILAIVEEALSAGIEEVGIVVQESDRQPPLNIRYILYFPWTILPTIHSLEGILKDRGIRRDHFPGRQCPL